MQIFAGGATKVREAGAAITGGHTVTNPEPFYGMSVTGWVDPGSIMRKGGARPGDRLFLTKPLGTGVITTAAKLTGEGESAGASRRPTTARQARPGCAPPGRGRASPCCSSIAPPARRPRPPTCAARPTSPASDCLGMRAEMAVASGKEAGAGLRIRAADVPVLPGCTDYIDAGYLTRGATLNPEEFGEHVRFADRRAGACADAAVGGGDQRRAAAGCTCARGGPLPCSCAERKFMLGDR